MRVARRDRHSGTRNHYGTSTERAQRVAACSRHGRLVAGARTAPLVGISGKRGGHFTMIGGPVRSSGQHYAATTDEEEEIAMALALSASLAESSSGRIPSQARGSAVAPSAPRQPDATRYNPQPWQQPAQPPQPQYPQYPPVAVQPTQPYPRPSTSTQPAPAPAAPYRPQQGSAGSSAPPPAISPAAKRALQATPARKMHPDTSKCAGCGKAVWTQRLNALNRMWHPQCFTCGFCSGPVNEGGNARFAIGNDDGWPYHMECYRMRFHPVCTVCQTFVPAHADGRVEYKEQTFWRETYCTKHGADGTPTCCSCSRFQPNGTEFAQLADGRHLCLICLGTLVVDTRDAQPLYKEVMSFFKNLGMPLPSEAPFMLVDAFTLNEYSDKEGKDHSGGPVFHVRGLTLATVYRSIPTIIRAAGSGGLGVSTINTSVPQAQGSVTCKVSAILVMYGLPRLLTGCIMAHELMHAWFRMKNVAGLDQKVEEGLCQLMAYVWLDHQANSLTEPNEQRLASYFAYQIREDTSVVYGDGFREAYDAFQQRGLMAIVNDVLRRGKFH